MKTNKRMLARPTRNSNKAMYESIMSKVSKVVKQSLNESRSPEEYEKWKNAIIRLYGFMDEIVFSVWKMIYEHGKETGYGEYLKDDIDDVIDMIVANIDNAKKRDYHYSHRPALERDKFVY